MSDSKFITLTLDPSLERTLVTHFMSSGYHNRTSDATRLDAAGEGFSIARALHRLECEVRAITLLGEDATGRAYRSLTDMEGFEVVSILREGRTRSSTVIKDTGHSQETQISDDNAALRPAVIRRVSAALNECVAPGDIVVLAGALPGGTPLDTYSRLIEVTHGLGAQVVVVAPGNALSETLAAGPDLVTLTRVELEGFCNFPVHELEDIVGCARKLQESGAARVLVEIRGMQSALLVTREDVMLVEVSPEEAGTSSGVWSALVAGYLAGRVHRHPVENALEMGAGAARFTATQVGQEFGTPAEVEDFVDEVRVNVLSGEQGDQKDENTIEN